ncbi:MAG TPA: HAD family hydrolase [Ignavibacteriaceae bacterium]|nr:HAD family hydrolase [Ignavibacteriaceae bacterium]
MKAVLFDFGGTLDTNGIHWSEKFRIAYEEANLGINLEDFNEAYVKAEPQMYIEVKREDDFYTTLKKQAFLQLNYLEKNKNYSFPGTAVEASERIAEKCYKGVLEVVESIKTILIDIKKDYKLCVVSNFYGNLETALKGLNISEYFDLLIDSTLVNIRKPDPKIFKLAIEKLNVFPENTVVIGDSYLRDIKPAKSLNCKTIWLDVSSWTKPEETDSADIIIKNIMEIKEIIDKLFSR